MSKATTPHFRVSYPKVFRPELNKLSKKEEFSVVALFPKGADLSVLKKAAQDACEKEWGADKTKWPPGLRSPFRDQGERIKAAIAEEKAPPAGYEDGAIYLNLKSKNKPGVVDQNVQDIIVESDFYAGCWARATVFAQAYAQAGNKGVSFYLQNVQKVKEGEPLGGKVAPQNDFAPIEGTASTGPVNSASDLFG